MVCLRVAPGEEAEASAPVVGGAELGKEVGFDGGLLLFGEGWHVVGADGGSGCVGMGVVGGDAYGVYVVAAPGFDHAAVIEFIGGVCVVRFQVRNDMALDILERPSYWRIAGMGGLLLKGDCNGFESALHGGFQGG